MRQALGDSVLTRQAALTHASPAVTRARSRPRPCLCSVAWEEVTDVRWEGLQAALPDLESVEDAGDFRLCWAHPKQRLPTGGPGPGVAVAFMWG